MNEVYYSTGIPLGNATSVHHIHSKLSKAIRSMLDQILLQEDVNAILLWAKDNNMELNEEKFQLIQHGKISHLKPTTSEIYKTSQGTSLNPTDVVVDLGVTINEGLN